MIVAVVDDTKITDTEYQTQLKRIMRRMRLERPNRACRDKALDYLIDNTLLLREARAINVTVSEDLVQGRILEIMMEYESEEEYRSMLENLGLSETDLTGMIEKDLTIKHYIKTRFKPVHKDVPESQLEKFYHDNRDQFATPERIKVSHILIRGTDPEALQKIQELKAQIDGPEDFGKIAAIVSECPSHMQAGELGYIVRGKMIPEFERVAFSLPLLQVSDPVKTLYGYHLIMVTERIDKRLADFEEIKDALKKRLLQIDSELQVIRHVKQLRHEAEIHIYPERL